METGKSRIARVLARAVPDRVPLDVGGINTATVHWKAEDALKQYLGFSPTDPVIYSKNQQVVVPDERLLEYFEVDTRCLYVDEMRPWQEGSRGVCYDQLGVGRVFDGNYYTMVEHPLQGKSLREALDTYEWPNPYAQVRLAGLEERAKSYGGKYCLVMDGLGEVSFGTPSWMRGMTDFYMDLAAEPDVACEFLDRHTDWLVEIIDFALTPLGKYVDIVKIADDLGTQSSLIISPKMYRDLIKPRHARIVQAIKSKGPRVLLHSCGAVRPLINDFIEIGIDALNPVQISAVGMEPEGLKRDFGDRIVFWGGGIDTQLVLPTGTRTEIRAEVKKNMDIFKRNGGYVFAQVHNIQPDVPVENMIAMFEAYREYRDY
jgi:uroporphyrinogen decarboxylase